tara:strand:- start:386 stop:586 length:201 start_codon:yes stop_codon:yes gene_type:complete
MKYQISLSSGRANGKVILSNVECSDWTVADDFATTMASLMPEATYYCQKNSRNITQEWSGSAEEQG